MARWDFEDYQAVKRRISLHQTAKIHAAGQLLAKLSKQEPLSGRLTGKGLFTNSFIAGLLPRCFILWQIRVNIRQAKHPHRLCCGFKNQISHIFAQGVQRPFSKSIFAAMQHIPAGVPAFRGVLSRMYLAIKHFSSERPGQPRNPHRINVGNSISQRRHGPSGAGREYRSAKAPMFPWGPGNYMRLTFSSESRRT